MLVTTDFVHDRRVRQEARSLAEAGHQVTVIATSGLEESDLYISEAQDMTEIVESIKPVRLVQVSVPPRSKIRVKRIKLAVDATRCYMPAFFRFLRAAIKERADVYHCHNIDTLLMGYIASRLSHAQLVFDCHDIYSEIKAKGTFVKAFGPVWKIMERFLPSRADAVIATCDSHAEYISSRRKKVHPLLVYNCPYVHHWEKTSRIREYFNIPPGDKIVLYFGTMWVDRGVELIIESSQYFLPQTRLVLLGTTRSEYRCQLEEKIASLPNWDRVHLSGYVPMEEVSQYLMSADLTVIPFENLSLTYDLLPWKLFETMMAGLPIVASALPAMRRIIEESDCGIIVEEITPQAFAAAINKLVAAPDLMKHYSVNSRRAAESKYNWENESQKLINLYHDLAQVSGHG